MSDQVHIKETSKQITTCEMRCLLKNTNVIRRDRIRKSDIRKTVGTTPCNQHIEQQQMKWFGHLMKMEPSQLPSRAYNNRQSGSRAREDQEYGG
jgi:hypothetical protein